MRAPERASRSQGAYLAVVEGVVKPRPHQLLESALPTPPSTHPPPTPLHPPPSTPPTPRELVECVLGVEGIGSVGGGPARSQGPRGEGRREALLPTKLVNSRTRSSRRGAATGPLARFMSR